MEAVTKQRKKQKQHYTPIDRKDMKMAYLMLAPALVMLTIFVIVPLVMAVQKSFFEWNFYTDSVFVGLKNFQVILKTVYFQQAVWNAFKFVIIIVPSMMAISFLFALLLKNMSSRFANFVKTAIYIPGIVSGIAASIIFLFVMEFRGGLLNQLVMSFGMERIPWLTSPFWATLSVVIPTIWLGLGANVILMYAGLVNVPGEYYEAASIDGANAWHKMVRITIPQMKNIFVLMCINLTTGTLQLFDMPYLLTLGGPRNSTLTPMLYLYNQFRDQTKGMGYTIAGALLMMMMIAIINSFIFTVIKSEKSLEG